MTPFRKVLLVLAAAFAFVLAALVVLPLAFKGRIVDRARREIDRTVAAHVDWSGIGLTFFRDFPNLTLSVADLSVVTSPPSRAGVAAEPKDAPTAPGDTLATPDLGADTPPDPSGDTLATVRNLRVVLDLGSVWRAWRRGEPVVVRSIRVDRPMAKLHVGEDGSANWDVLNRSAAEAATTDAPTADAALAGTSDAASAGATATDADAVPSSVTADTPGAGSRIRSASLELRSLEIADGDVSFRNDATGLIAALDGLDYTLAGNFALDHVVARTRAHADHTTVTFAGMPYLSRVAMDFRADIDADLANRHFTFQDNELRLNDLSIRFAGEATRRDDGVALDVTFDAPRTGFAQALSLLPAVYAHDFASLETAGTFRLQGNVRGTYGPAGLPAFSLEAAVEQGMFRYPDLPLPARDISFDLSIESPGGAVDSTVIRLDDLHVVIGEQPLDAAVTLRTPVADPDVDARLRGTLDLAAMARTIKLDSVRELSGVVTADAAVRARLSDIDAARYGRVAARGTVSARDVTFEGAQLPYPVALHEMTLDLTPRRADLKSLDARIGESDVQASGTIDNILAFLLRDDEPLRGTATVHSRRFVLDEWKSDDPTLEVIPVPALLDVSLDGTVDSLVYGPLAMSEARGHVTLRDERLTLDDFTLETLGGRIGFKGYYDTTEPTRPTFDMGLTIDSLDVAGAAAAFLTVRTLAPVARFAQGTFSTKLDLSGALNQDMTPVFDALAGKGSLLTSRIAFQDFPMFARLAEVVKIPRLSNPTLDAIRSTLSIEDGRMHVRPFRVGVGDLRMSVEGSNGIDQSLDYTLGLTVPRGTLGDAANQVVQGLAAKANLAGLNLQTADSVRLSVKVGGTITAPSLELGLGQAVASTEQQLTDAADAAVDAKVEDARALVEDARSNADSSAAEARRRAQARADSIVADAESRADTIRAEARRLAAETRAEAKRRADAAVSKATNPIARKAAQAVADRILKEANDKADAAVREADARADALVAEARKRADELVGGVGG